MRLIDADKLKTHYAWWKGGTRELTMDEAKSDFDTIIDLQPSVSNFEDGAEFVQVVRCKDCIHGFASGQCVKSLWIQDPNGFCSMGERRTDETN